MISFQNGVFCGTGNILGYDKIGKDLIVYDYQLSLQIIERIQKIF